MADTTIATVANQIRTEWGPVFDMELREKFILPALVDKTPGGLSTIRQGDTIKVSQVNKMTGELLTIGTNADAFTPEALALQNVDVVVDKRAVASIVVDDLVELQSQINLQRQDVRDAMGHGMNSQINTHLYSTVAPTTTTTAATLAASDLLTAKLEADQKFWPEGQRWCIVDPAYYSDLLADQTITNNDFGASDRPVIGGQFVLQRYGWNIVMDNSAAMTTALNAGTAGAALFFIPNFMYFVIQQAANTKVSDRHSNNEFKIGMSVDTVFGALLSNDGADKHIVYKSL